MKQRRVKITGIGPVTAAGIGREAFLRGIVEPVSRVKTLVPLGEGNGALVAAADVGDFRVGAFALDAVHLQSPRHVQFALAGTVLSLRDAGILLADLRKKKSLVSVAYPMAERSTYNEPIASDSGAGVRLHQTQAAVELLVGARTGVAAEVRRLSSLDAIGHAAEQVASGVADIAICGGADAPLTESILAELNRHGLSPNHAKEPDRLCRPFDLWRTTGVAGEGACMFVLEPETSPRRAYAWVAGSARATEQSGRPWSGLGEALRLALGNARLRPAEIDCIQAEGLGHASLDQAEAAALGTALGARLASIPVVSIKGAVGNALGAAGAIQVGCAALGMKHALIAPTTNWHHYDPSCPLNLSASSRSLAMQAMLVVDRDPAGRITCLLLKQ